MRVFIDTNLWAYRLDRREPDKSEFVGNWLRELALENEIVISTQVLIELRSVLTRKLKPALSWHDTRAALEALAEFEVVPANTSLVLDAHELSRARKLSWFDALIVEAAIRSGCERLYSEDLGHEQMIEELKVENPFISAE
ncbi:PIN domain-containing protein [Wenzhouxiangella limi]|uniref:Ribonuclease VapC n=1 Tax=Wenzhouxiangella limi TaxID=2707351 RepID=A0A845VEX8_9GAMM|nr:PIN domain-containing protein [Wenzhouxiangella limi]NDY95789.1 PIN domain-containing protein [Wenzhouxiangella limi]